MTIINQQTPPDKDIHFPGLTESKEGVTVFLFGGIGSWKTSWAGQWPSPIFFSAGAEGGDDALAMLPQISNGAIQTPPVYQIRSVEMMKQKVDLICMNYKKWGIKTVVIDSLTFYSDLWVSEVIKKKLAANKEAVMVQRDWGLIENHIVKDLAQKLHNTNLNVIWIALQKDKMNADGSIVESVKPYVQGAAAIKLPAMCKMVIHADKQMIADTVIPGRMLSKPIFWTSASMLCKDVRHKYGNAFHEGCLIDSQGGTYPTYWGVEQRIGQFIYK